MHSVLLSPENDEKGEIKGFSSMFSKLISTESNFINAITDPFARVTFQHNLLGVHF